MMLECLSEKSLVIENTFKHMVVACDDRLLGVGVGVGKALACKIPDSSISSTSDSSEHKSKWKSQLGAMVNSLTFY